MNEACLTKEVLGEQYQWLKNITKMSGLGPQGVVFYGTHMKTNERLCIKFSDITGEHQRKFFEREVAFLGEHKHNRIIPMIAYDNFYYHHSLLGVIFTPWIELESLSTYLTCIGFGSLRCQEDTLFHLMGQLIDVVSFLHSKNILHHSIKPENIFVSDYCSSKPKVYLSNFGSSVELTGSHSECSCMCGDFCCLAPEQEEGSSHSFPLDVYQLGIVFSLLFDQCKENLSNKIFYNLYNLIRNMLEYDPSKRPVYSDVQSYWSSII